MKTLFVDVAILGFGTSGMNAYRSAAKHTKILWLFKMVPTEQRAPVWDVCRANSYLCRRCGVYPRRSTGVWRVSRRRYQNLWSSGSGTSSITSRCFCRTRSFERGKIPEEQRILGTARFISDTEVLVDDHTKIQAKAFVVATGSSPRLLPHAELLGDRHIVNDDVFEWDHLPESVAVFGTGVIGMELGQALKRLGVRVTLFGRSGNVAAFTDPDLQQIANDLFHRELDVFPVQLFKK